MNYCNLHRRYYFGERKKRKRKKEYQPNKNEIDSMTVICRYDDISEKIICFNNIVKHNSFFFWLL